MNNKAKGYLLAAISSATYGMNPLFSLPLFEDGMSVDSVLFFRYLFAVPMVAIMLKSRGRSFAVSRKEVWPLLLVGVFFVLSSIVMYFVLAKYCLGHSHFRDHILFGPVEHLVFSIHIFHLFYISTIKN